MAIGKKYISSCKNKTRQNWQLFIIVPITPRNANLYNNASNLNDKCLLKNQWLINIKGIIALW